MDTNKVQFICIQAFFYPEICKTLEFSYEINKDLIPLTRLAIGVALKRPGMALTHDDATALLNLDKELANIASLIENTD